MLFWKVGDSLEMSVMLLMSLDGSSPLCSAQTSAQGERVGDARIRKCWMTGAKQILYIDAKQAEKESTTDFGPQVPESFQGYTECRSSVWRAAKGV